MGTRVRCGAVLALLVAAPHLAGCLEIIEANVKAVDTLGRDSATDEETGMAIAVIGGTTAFLAGLGIAASIAAIQVGGDDPAPPEVVVVDELAWGFERDGGDARWYRCTSRLMCTHERVTERADAVLSVTPAGRGQPLAVDGTVGGDVDLFAVRVRRRR